MRKNILLIQFRKNNKIARHEKKCILKVIGYKMVNLTCKNLFVDGISLSKKDLSNIDGIIIGGSGDFSFSKKEQHHDLFEIIKKSIPFVKDAIKRNIPILGICLGHQYLAYLLGSKVVNDKKQEEFGTFKASLTTSGKTHPLFRNIPTNFLVQEGHEDCIKKLAKDITILAKGQRCKIQSFCLGRIFAVQFHPELAAKKDMIARQNEYAGYKRSFKPAPYSLKVIKNFLDLILLRSFL